MHIKLQSQNSNFRVSFSCHIALWMISSILLEHIPVWGSEKRQGAKSSM
jgi:hypothetical protein